MANPQVLLTGLAFGESPRWHDGRLWVSDWGAGEVLAVDAEGRRETMARLNSFPLCVDFLPDGRLLLVDAAGRLVRQEPDGTQVTHADLRGLSPHPWNDIVVDGRGAVYVNNVHFDFPGGEYAPGLIALVTPEGRVRQVADDLAFPNGMAVTPDNATLIVAESYAGRLRAFDIAPNGALANSRVCAEVPGSAPDGICLDADGAVWYGDVPNRSAVRVRAGGEVLQTVTLDRGCFACMLGGPGRRTLYLVATEWRGPDEMQAGQRTGQVLHVAAPAAGVGWP